MVGDSMLAQALGEQLKLRVLHLSLIFAQSLANIGADERLITTEAE